MPPIQNFDTGSPGRKKFNFDIMTAPELELLLVATPEGRRINELIVALEVDADLEKEIRGVVAQALQAGALIARIV